MAGSDVGHVSRAGYTDLLPYGKCRITSRLFRPANSSLFPPPVVAFRDTRTFRRLDFTNVPPRRAAAIGKLFERRRTLNA